VRKVAERLIEDERMPLRVTNEWYLFAGEVDLIEGELYRKVAGWMQRRNIKGNYDAWVTGLDGKTRLMRLPFAHVWDAVSRDEVDQIPDSMQCYEWPTGAPSNVLERIADRDGLPAFRVRARREDE
jgi:hypothetical protein